MIVRTIMTTKLVTVTPDDTLAHAANLLRQHQFHHLPVARSVRHQGQKEELTMLVLEGILTSQDIDLAAALSAQEASQAAHAMPWQERRVVEIMHRAAIRVTPSTPIAAAAQVMGERGLNYLPVVEYVQLEHENRTVLVGLLTRSDLLIALARALGAFEPGMQLRVALPVGDITQLARTLLLAAELRVPIRSVIAAPLEGNVPQEATIRLGTINPAPLLKRLQEEGIDYAFGNPLNSLANPLEEGTGHA